MSLKDDLTEIKGVGDATAESILEVLAEHDGERDPEEPEDAPDGFQMVSLTPDDHDSGGLNNRLMQKAINAAEAGNEREASVFLRRANR